MKIISVFVIAIFAMITAGCSGDLPTCDEQETIEMVESLQKESAAEYFNNIGPHQLEAEIHEVKEYRSSDIERTCIVHYGIGIDEPRVEVEGQFDIFKEDGNVYWQVDGSAFESIRYY